MLSRLQILLLFMLELWTTQNEGNQLATCNARSWTPLLRSLRWKTAACTRRERRKSFQFRQIEYKFNNCSGGRLDLKGLYVRYISAAAAARIPGVNGNDKAAFSRSFARSLNVWVNSGFFRLTHSGVFSPFRNMRVRCRLEKGRSATADSYSVSLTWIAHEVITIYIFLQAPAFRFNFSW